MPEIYSFSIIQDYFLGPSQCRVRQLLQMRIFGNLREITEIIWLTKEVSWDMGNSYGITGLIVATKMG
jgi:hypothetical protein